MIGGTVALHEGGLHNDSGGKIQLDDVWCDTDELLNQGVIRIKENCFLDSRQVINQRLQHTWDERHTKTVKKKKYGGLSSSKKQVTETTHCAESLPLEISGGFHTGSLRTQMMPQKMLRKKMEI